MHKSSYTLLAIFISLSISAQNKESKENRLYGDFNGDGVKEYAWVKSPERLDDSYNIDWGMEDERGDLHMYCPGGCNSVLYFSDKSIVPITIENSWGGKLENFGDLNNDGSDNIGFYNRRVALGGTGSTLYIFKTKNSHNNYKNLERKDYLLIEPLDYRSDVLEHHKIEKPIRKLDGNRLEVIEVFGYNDEPIKKIIKL